MQQEIASAEKIQTFTNNKMGIMEKLEILSCAAKYDVACTSSGVDRKGNGKDMGGCLAAGICHSFSSDGRCISLLKILMSNECIFDCKYCINRRSNDLPRATFTPDEICELTMNFYRRNYIEGLFLRPLQLYRSIHDKTVYNHYIDFHYAYRPPGNGGRTN